MKGALKPAMGGTGVPKTAAGLRRSPAGSGLSGMRQTEALGGLRTATLTGTGATGAQMLDVAAPLSVTSAERRTAQNLKGPVTASLLGMRQGAASRLDASLGLQRAALPGGTRRRRQQQHQAFHRQLHLLQRGPLAALSSRMGTPLLLLLLLALRLAGTLVPHRRHQRLTLQLGISTARCGGQTQSCPRRLLLGLPVQVRAAGLPAALQKVNPPVSCGLLWEERSVLV